MSKLLPRNPTHAMQMAGAKLFNQRAILHDDWRYSSEVVKEIWQEMYAASGRKENEIKEPI